MDDNDRDWHYRLSLYYVKKEDSNEFTCKTPRGQVNSVRVVVTGKHFFFNFINKI